MFRFSYNNYNLCGKPVTPTQVIASFSLRFTPIAVFIGDFKLLVIGSNFDFDYIQALNYH